MGGGGFRKAHVLNGQVEPFRFAGGQVELGEKSTRDPGMEEILVSLGGVYQAVANVVIVARLC